MRETMADGKRFELRAKVMHMKESVTQKRNDGHPAIGTRDATIPCTRTEKQAENRGRHHFPQRGFSFLLEVSSTKRLPGTQARKNCHNTDSTSGFSILIETRHLLSPTESSRRNPETHDSGRNGNRTTKAPMKEDDSILT